MNTEQRLLRKRIWSRPWFIVLSVLVLIVALFVFYRLNQKSALDKKLDEIRAAGYPTTYEELDKLYSIPQDVNNAAGTILDAIASLQQWPRQDMEDLPFVGTRYPPSRTETMTEPMKETITEYLADNAKALELLHKASQIKHCRFPVDYSVPKIDYPYDLRKSLRLLALETVLQVQENQSDAVVDSIEAALRLSQCLDKDPLLTSQFTRIHSQAKAMEALEYAINQIKFSDQQLNALSRAIEDAKNPDAMRYGFASEIIGRMDFFNKPTPQGLGHFGRPSLRLLNLYTAIGMTNRDAIITFDIMLKYIEAYKLPPVERLKAVKAVAEEAGNIPKIRILARVTIPAFANAAATDCRTIAHLDAGRVALAVERYRLANRKLPDNLNSLVPKFLESVPIDPFDGKPLKYKKLDPGFVIYSIGQDEQDDGGKERGPKRKKPNDVTFIIER